MAYNPYNSLEYRSIPDTYASVLFIYPSDDISNNLELRTGHGYRIPFGFNTTYDNNEKGYGSIRCYDGNVKCTNLTINTMQTCSTVDIQNLYTDIIQLTSTVYYSTINGGSSEYTYDEIISSELKMVVTDQNVQTYFDQIYTDNYLNINEISSVIGITMPNNRNTTAGARTNAFSFNVTEDQITEYFVMLVPLNIFISTSSTGNMRAYLNNSTTAFTQRYLNTNATGPNPKGHIYTSLLYTFAPGELQIGTNTVRIELPSGITFYSSVGFQDTLILHGN